MGVMDEYKKKLVSADQAVKVVKSGDWVDYGSFLGQVRDLDKALAKRKDELKDVKIWTCVNPYGAEVNNVDPTGEHFVWNSWHFSGGDRKVVKAGKTPLFEEPKAEEAPAEE